MTSVPDFARLSSIARERGKEWARQTAERGIVSWRPWPTDHVAKDQARRWCVGLATDGVMLEVLALEVLQAAAQTWETFRPVSRPEGVARALAVHRNALMADAMTTLLRAMYGFQGRAATSSTAAFEETCTFRPDVVLFHEHALTREEARALRRAIRPKPFTILFSHAQHSPRRFEADAFVCGILGSRQLDAALEPWLRGNYRGTL